MRNLTHEMADTLGQSLFVTGFTVDSVLTPQAVEAALIHLVEQIRMDTGGLPAQVWQFPLPSGQGGTGATVVQPLVESFSIGFLPAGAVIGDSWCDHEHTFFVIASCRPYDVRQVKDWLTCYIGTVLDSGGFRLGVDQ